MDEQLRRQSVGAPAARSALLTLLGEFVAPRKTAVRRRGLVAGLEALGYKTAAARQAVARNVDGGWLRRDPGGERSLLVIEDEALRMLHTGYPRIFGFGDPWTWDGRWLLLVVTVPERQRGLRDRLRSKLSWAGFGSLGGGVWITPHASREGEVRAAVAESPGLEVHGFSAGQITDLGDSAALVAQAWDLPAVAAQYREFVADFGSLEPDSDLEAFRDQTAMVHAWRKFPFLDPELPEELLPADWPGAVARDLFRDRHARWRAAAERFFAGLESGAPPDV